MDPTAVGTAAQAGPVALLGTLLGLALLALAWAVRHIVLTGRRQDRAGAEAASAKTPDTPSRALPAIRSALDARDLIVAHGHRIEGLIARVGELEAALDESTSRLAQALEQTAPALEAWRAEALRSLREVVRLEVRAYLRKEGPYAPRRDP